MPLEIIWPVLAYAINNSAVAIAVLSLYVMVKATPDPTKIYRIVLSYSSISNITASLITIFCLPRYVYNKKTILYVHRGLCVITGKYSCYFGMSVMVASYGHMCFVLIYPFGFRLYSLYTTKVSKKLVIFVLVSVLIPSLFLVALPIKYLIEHMDDNFEQTLQEVHPELNASQFVLNGAPNYSEDWTTSLATIMSLGAVIPVIGNGILMTGLIKRKFITNVNISENTRRMINNFLRVMHLQSALPFFYLTAVALFIYNSVSDTHFVPVEYSLVTLCSMISLLMSCITLYFITPYRQYIRDMYLGFMTKPIIPLTSQTSYSHNKSLAAVEA